MADAKPVAACRSCGGPPPLPVLDLGETPIANALVEQGDLGAPDARYPLQVGFCPVCSLVQLTHELPADAIFNASYPYFSSFSDTLCRHARDHALGLIERRDLTKDSYVVEVASNDGYLLRNFVQAGIPVLGIEPTAGPAAAARDIGIPTLERFFTFDLAQQLASERRADVIVANNVMAHVPDLNGFVAGLAALISDNGVITIENPWVRDLIEQVEFDTIYHEHFCYFSCLSVQRLLERHGLYLNDVDYFPSLHGGTLRWTAGRTSEPTSRVVDFLGQEAELGMAEFAYYAGFAARVRATQDALTTTLQRLRAEGATIAAYGAAAKGATLLNSSGIDSSVVDFVVDRNTHKQGRWMPGARIPIVDPVALVERQPDYLLLLAWNFKEEIIAQQEGYRSRGGKFVVPIPTTEIL